jgi:hypothetical protein
VPRIAGLARIVGSGLAATRFTEEDYQAFSGFMLARQRRYPLFFAAKHAWVILLDALPPVVSQVLTHHVQLRVNQGFRLLNRATAAAQGGDTSSLARSPM